MSFSHKPTSRKKPRAPHKKFVSYAQRSEMIENMDEDSLGHAMTDEEIARHEDQQNRRSFSYLSADAVRWIQKHKPAASSSTKNFIPPQRVLQLRSIFKGLDFDGSGEIDLNELKDAVKYVAQQDNGSQPPLFEHPDAIVKIFSDMDVDGNGNVDFDEFLIGMTSEQASGSTGGAGVSGTRMQNAFFDFANQHRRQTIIDKITDSSGNSQDRYNELRKLYNMKYMKDEPMDCTVDEMISKMKQEAMLQKKEMNKMGEKYRKAEINRARAAHIYFDSEMPGKGHPNYTISTNDLILKKIRRDMVTNALSTLTGKPEEDMKSTSKANRTVRTKMCAFSLDIGDTYTPSLLTRTTSCDLERRVHDAAYNVKNAPALKSSMLPKPESLSQAVFNRVENAKQIHFADKNKVETVIKKPTSGLALANLRRAERQGGLSIYGGNKSSSVIKKVVSQRRASTNIAAGSGSLSSSSSMFK